ncbi:MAG: S8 family serine peptidase [Clostridium sp.]
MGISDEFLKKIGYSKYMNSEAKDKVEVIIISGEKVEDVKAFVESLGGEYENLGYGYAVVTIAVEKLIDLFKSDLIQFLELPKSLYISDEYSNRAACVPELQTTYSLLGQGVLVGFIDTGIDYTHPAFKNEDGTTRIEYIYDLSNGKNIYDKNKINEALKSQDPMSIVPSNDQVDHGTHVAGIACAGGNIPKSMYGVAPRSSIIMVKCARGQYSLSTNILRGLKFLVDKSKELKMPLAVNISLSTNDGAHNGTSLLEKYIQTVCDLERITIVIASGNEGASAHHVGGVLKKQQTIEVNIANDESIISFNLYEAILPLISIEIINPIGKSTGEVTITEGVTERILSGDKITFVVKGPNPFDLIGESTITILAGAEYLVGGQWKLIIRVLNDFYGKYDIWLPVSEGLNTKTKFAQPVVYNTLGIPATVKDVISVGSYNYVNYNISPFSGRGAMDQIGDVKPELVAPGENIMAPISGSGFDKKSGTSMAAPHVTGIVALLMEWGIVKKNDPYLYGERLKYNLIKGAKRIRLDSSYPNPVWGYGAVCGAESLEYVIESIKSFNSQRGSDDIYSLYKEYTVGNIFIRKPIIRGEK